MASSLRMPPPCKIPGGFVGNHSRPFSRSLTSWEQEVDSEARVDALRSLAIETLETLPPPRPLTAMSLMGDGRNSALSSCAVPSDIIMRNIHHDSHGSTSRRGSVPFSPVSGSGGGTGYWSDEFSQSEDEGNVVFPW